jgi:hypothetical protein
MVDRLEIDLPGHGSGVLGGDSLASSRCLRVESGLDRTRRPPQAVERGPQLRSDSFVAAALFVERIDECV